MKLVAYSFDSQLETIAKLNQNLYPLLLKAWGLCRIQHIIQYLWIYIKTNFI